MLINRVSFENCKDFIADMSTHVDSDNSIQLDKAKIAIRKIITYELTQRQKQVALLYFYEQKNIPEIALMLGVNKSTVSRTLARALKRINDRMKYTVLR